MAGCRASPRWRASWRRRGDVELNEHSPFEDLLRALAPQVLGTLTRHSGDFDAAEDAVQEALIAAADHWPREGIPPNPRAWLQRTASRRLIDHVRSEQARSGRELQTALLEPAVSVAGVEEDDTLALLFMCAHPALTPASSIALTLRAVGGLTTAEIAKAFLVPEATMAQRISRAKRTIKASGVPFRLPSPDDQVAALPSVLHVLYLIFNEGYAGSAGRELQRVDLSDEAIRLTIMVHDRLPADGEAAGLLALMLLLDARRPARTTTDGDVVSLADQDRTLWDRHLIERGTALLNEAVARGRVGDYQLQAAIAAIHDRAPRAADTDWPQILALYGLLERMTGNPVVTVNRAVAAAMAEGPAAGLAILDGMDESLAGHHRLEAVRAHLLEMAGDTDAALRHYRMAARLTTNLAEQRYLTSRAARLRADDR
jgi:RNA polymerase sigma factor (sigma-70 family)